jgi:hypothetical protein
MRSRSSPVRLRNLLPIAGQLRALLLVVFPLLVVGCTHASIVPADLRKPGVIRPRCNAARTLRRLSKKPQVGLDIVDIATSALTTPFKKLGLVGWRDTGCDAAVVGVPVREAQHSSGGFYTIDLRLLKFEVEGKLARPGRFLRIEISPDTKAKEVASKTSITTESKVTLGGPVVIDEDGPFLEVHPGNDFRVVNGKGTP